jgi:phage gpG-like protein
MAVQTMRFVPNHAVIDRLLHGRDDMVAKEMEKRALKVQAGAIRQVGKRTGKLARSIHVELTLRPLTGAYIGSNVRYALMHHEGTKRHLIVAKPGRMLTFTSNGKRIYARKVLHPGTSANRFLTDNLIKAVR